MTKTKNRNDFPKAAKIIDAFRKQFSDLNVLYVRENNKELGKK